MGNQGFKVYAWFKQGCPAVVTLAYVGRLTVVNALAWPAALSRFGCIGEQRPVDDGKMASSIRHTCTTLFIHSPARMLPGTLTCDTTHTSTFWPTGSLDRTVRLWDLASGLPLACTKPQKGTVRSVALDDHLLLSGGTDHAIRLFTSHTSHSTHGANGSSSGGYSNAAMRGGPAGRPSPFDLSQPHAILRDHSGPVSSLYLADHALYSGSWDCTGRFGCGPFQVTSLR